MERWGQRCCRPVGLRKLRASWKAVLPLAPWAAHPLSPSPRPPLASTGLSCPLDHHFHVPDIPQCPHSQMSNPQVKSPGPHISSPFPGDPILSVPMPWAPTATQGCHSQGPHSPDPYSPTARVSVPHPPGPISHRCHTVSPALCPVSLTGVTQCPPPRVPSPSRVSPTVSHSVPSSRVPSPHGRHTRGDRGTARRGRGAERALTSRGAAMATARHVVRSMRAGRSRSRPSSAMAAAR